MDREIEDKFSELNKKIEDQFRFTRNVIALCTLTIIGVLIFTIMSAADSLPPRIIFHYMSNLDGIVRQWDACEKLHIYQEVKKNEKKKKSEVETTQDAAPETVQKGNSK